MSEAHAMADAVITKQRAANKFSPSVQRYMSEHKEGLRLFSDLFSIMGDDSEAPTTIQLFPLGTFNTGKYGEIVITKEALEQMVVNFSKKVNGVPVRAGVPIDVDHDKGKAAGWIKELKVMSDGLYSVNTDWTPYGKQLIKNKEYRFLSPEFSDYYVDPEHSDIELENVLIAASLVNRPLFKELKPLTASEDLTRNKKKVMIFTDMNFDLATLRNARPETLLPEAKAFLVEHKAELTAEEVTSLKLEEAPAAPVAPVVEPVAPVVEPVAPVVEPTPAPTEPVVPAADAAITAKEGNVTMTASEVKVLKEAAEELDTKKVEDIVNPLVASETNEQGKVLPANKDKVVKFAKGLSAPQRKEFSEIMLGLAAHKVFGEQGAADVSTAGPKIAIIKQKVKEAREADKNLSEADATKKVMKENPELMEYGEEMTVVKSKF
jgi:phage I-like protein